MREMLIRCFLDAHHRVCTQSNIRSGFEASGIFSLDPKRPLESEYTLQEIPDNIKVPPEDEILFGKWTNSVEMLSQLIQLQHNHPQTKNLNMTSLKSLSILKTAIANSYFSLNFHKY